MNHFSQKNAHSKTSASTSDSGIENDLSVDANFRPLRIKVFRNGDEHDVGQFLNVTRRQFKHWITFLDVLTDRMDMNAPVHKLFRIDGAPIHEFEELEPDGRYVAVSSGPFIFLDYGGYKARNMNKAVKSWKTDRHFEAKDPSPLDSSESIEIYLQKSGYKSKTGLPFPFDGIKTPKPPPNATPHPPPPSRMLASMMSRRLSAEDLSPRVPRGVHQTEKRNPLEDTWTKPSQTPIKSILTNRTRRGGYSSATSSMVELAKNKYDDDVYDGYDPDIDDGMDVGGARKYKWRY
uniref:Doublecortin domain-containing protein n=1 Tax=Plectus sambesii TaxID=2011161 RepID=A0A914URJ7_9BILA